MIINKDYIKIYQNILYKTVTFIYTKFNFFDDYFFNHSKDSFSNFQTSLINFIVTVSKFISYTRMCKSNENGLN